MIMNNKSVLWIGIMPIRIPILLSIWCLSGFTINKLWRFDLTTRTGFKKKDLETVVGTVVDCVTTTLLPCSRFLIYNMYKPDKDKEGIDSSVRNSQMYGDLFVFFHHWHRFEVRVCITADVEVLTVYFKGSEVPYLKVSFTPSVPLTNGSECGCGSKPKSSVTLGCKKLYFQIFLNVKICFMIKIKFLARKYLYWFYFATSFLSAQHFYEKTEGSGAWSGFKSGILLLIGIFSVASIWRRNRRLLPPHHQAWRSPQHPQAPLLSRSESHPTSLKAGFWSC